MDLDFVKELHFKELDRREHLDEVPGRLTSMLTLVAAVYTLYLKTLAPDNTWVSWLFAVSLVGTATLFILAIIWIFRASVGYGYAFLVSPADFEDYAQKLRQFHKSLGKDDQVVEAAVSGEVSAFLRERLIEAATVNSKNNNQRSELFYNVKRFLAGLAATTSLSGTSVLIQLWQKP